MTQVDLGDNRTARVVFGTNVTKLGLRLAAGGTTLRVRDATGYTAADVLVIDPGTDDEESLTIAAGGVTGLVITPTAVPIYAHGLNAPVWKLVDPTAVTLRVKEPDGTVTSYTYAAAELTKVSTGIYTRSLEPDQSGTHWIEATGTGAVVAVAESELVVRPSLVP